MDRAGLLVESIGSYVEFYWIDRPRRDHAQMLEDWWRFLRSSWKTEPIGLHYLRRLLVSFKFELNMAVAAGGMIPGFLLLDFRGEFGRSSTPTLLAIGVCATAAFGLFRMARTSAGVLADVRAELVKQLRRSAPFE